MAKNKIEEFYEKKGFNIRELLHPERIDNGKMKNSDEFIDRLKLAKDNNEDIVIFSDYDADGILSGVLTFEGLLRLGFRKKNIKVYPPSRNDGYGWDYERYQSLIDKDMKPDLMILVDNGIGIQETIKRMNEQETDVIVADHHFGKNTFKENEHHVIVDVNQIGDDYPFKGLSGTGTIWKLLLQYTDKYDSESRNSIEGLVDLVGLSNATDVMPVINENRWYMKKALEIMNSDDSRKAWSNFRKHEKRDITFNDFGWLIGPLLNADSRINGNANTAFKFIHSGDNDLLDKLFKFNDKRKQIKLEGVENADDSNGVIVINHGVSASFAGLIASEMSRIHKMPIISVVKSENEGHIHYIGSARSFSDFNLLKEFSGVHGLQINGHAGAAGVSFDEIDREHIIKVTNKIVEKWIENHASTQELIPDFDSNELTRRDMHILDAFEPFGNGLPRPLVHETINLLSDKSIRFMGKKQQHVKFQHQDGPDAVWWNSSDIVNDLLDRRINRIDVFGDLSINEFAGRSNLQLSIAEYIED